MELSWNVGSTIPNGDGNEQSAASNRYRSAGSSSKREQSKNCDPKQERRPKISGLRDNKESEQSQWREQKQSGSDPIPGNFAAEQKGRGCEQHSPAQIKEPHVIGDQEGDPKYCQTDDDPNAKRH